jgi:hypothetical protein
MLANMLRQSERLESMIEE